eukprot:gene19619-biopygen16065
MAPRCFFLRHLTVQHQPGRREQPRRLDLCPPPPESSKDRGRNESGRGPDADRHTIDFEGTDADRTRAVPFLPSWGNRTCPRHSCQIVTYSQRHARASVLFPLGST